jgi:lipoprotein-releasing system permease protein
MCTIEAQVVRMFNLKKVKWCNLPFEWAIGLKYFCSSKKQNRSLMSFVTLLSIFGIGIGVAVLIVVLSVMNGYEKKVMSGLLNKMSHIEIDVVYGDGLKRVDEIVQIAKSHQSVVGVAPKAKKGVLFTINGSHFSHVMLMGIDPSLEGQVSNFRSDFASNSVLPLKPGTFDIMVGGVMDDILSMTKGGQITLVMPDNSNPVIGLVPRFKTVRRVAVFNSDSYVYDSSLILMHIEDAKKILKLTAANSVQIKVRDAMQARVVAQEIEKMLKAADLGGVRDCPVS